MVKPRNARIIDEKGRGSNAKPIEPTPSTRKRKRRETAEWNAKNGSVTVRQKEEEQS